MADSFAQYPMPLLVSYEGPRYLIHDPRGNPEIPLQL